MIVLVLAAGCATVDPRPEQEQARAAIRAATGVADVHDPAAPPDAAVLATWLADGLSLDEALRLALLENGRLQAGFARLGLGKAELVRAGLWREPRLGFGVLLPSGGGAAQWSLDLAASVLDLWELPRREALARAELAGDVLELAHAATELATQVRVAYATAVAGDERVRLAREDEDRAVDERLAAEGRFAGGAVSARQVEHAQLGAVEARQARLAAERDAAGARAALGALFSRPEALDSVVLADPLPAPGPDPEPTEVLVARSLARRLDLAASRRDLEARRERLALEEVRRLPELDVTLSAERPELGNEPELLIGPGVALALPVGARRVERAAAAFELAAREAEHAALEAEVAQVVRSAAQRVRLAGEAAHQATRELVPAAERDLVRIRDARRLGRGDRSDELAAERGLLSARRVALEAGLAAALAEIELEQALGVLAPPGASPRLAAETARALP